MPDISKLLQQFDALEEVLEVDIGFHDYLLQSKLPTDRREHRGAGCLAVKKNHASECVKYCGAGKMVDSQILQQPEGWIHTCPFDRQQVAIDFLNDHIEDNLHLPDLATHLGFSDSHTSRWVRAQFKQTFSQLLLETRLSRAALLLSRSELSVTQIAFRLQFCDQSHFSKMFKRHFNISPLKHRRVQKELS